MGVITIGKKEFQVKEITMNQQDLVFYVDNPRVYSIIRENGNDNPSQHDIETYMRSMEHVKELKSQIEQNGGLLEALLVVKRNDEYEATGKSGHNYGKVKDFRVLMTSDDFIKSIKAEANGNPSIPFELKKIKKALDKLLKDLES